MEIAVSNLTLAPGDILIEKNRPNVWGWGAKALFAAEYQHALIVDLDPTVCIENSWIIKRRSTPTDLENYEVWRPMCDHETKVRALQFIYTRLDAPYGVLQLAALFLYRRFGIELPDVPLETCSEVPAWAFEQAGYDLNPLLPSYRTGPWDLRNPERLIQIILTLDSRSVVC